MLQHQSRVKFDPYMAEHRAAACRFLKRLSWKDAGIQFTEDPNYLSISTQITSKLLHWYMEQDELIGVVLQHHVMIEKARRILEEQEVVDTLRGSINVENE